MLPAANDTGKQQSTYSVLYYPQQGPCTNNHKKGSTVIITENMASAVGTEACANVDIDNVNKEDVKVDDKDKFYDRNGVRNSRKQKSNDQQIIEKADLMPVVDSSNPIGVIGTNNCETHREMANNAYSSIIKSFQDGVQAMSLLLSETDVTGRNYRGLLLGRSWENGATVDEFITARLQHDVGYSEVTFYINQISVKTIPCLSNKQIVKELCKTVETLLKKYSNEDQLKFASGEQRVNPGVVVALFNVERRKNISINQFGIEYAMRVQMLDQCLLIGVNQRKR